MAFALLHNGTTSSPVVSGISAPIAVANPNEPTGEHLTLTTDPACALCDTLFLCCRLAFVRPSCFAAADFDMCPRATARMRFLLQQLLMLNQICMLL